MEALRKLCVSPSQATIDGHSGGAVCHAGTAGTVGCSFQQAHSNGGWFEVCQKSGFETCRFFYSGLFLEKTLFSPFQRP
ncbi:hypothetical protein OBV_19370 [Oscillibacter valericigenes Sjm18-20]|nr:hypothetical protein OBV_19370 [Oscillibacter valericigenes Sjm18-20]